MFKQLETLKGELLETGLEASTIEKLTTVIDQVGAEATELSDNLKVTNDKFNDAIKTRDKAKEKYRKVVSTIGLPDEWTEDDLNGVVAKINGQAPKEVETLRKELLDKMERQKLQYEAQINDYQNSTKEQEQRIRELAFSREVQSILANEKEISPSAWRYVEQDLRNMPHRFDPETNSIVYVDKENNPRLGHTGKTLGVKDVFTSLKEKGEFDALIGVDVRGSGKSSNGSSLLTDPSAHEIDLLNSGVQKLGMKKGGTAIL